MVWMVIQNYLKTWPKKKSKIQARDIKSLIEVSSALSDRYGHNGHRSLEINHFRQEKREAKGKKYSRTDIKARRASDLSR